MNGEPPTDLEREIRQVLNRHSAENYSNTPDFVLANFLLRSMDAFTTAVKARDSWFKFNPWPNRPVEN
jgi:hypothetical protein